MGQEPCGYQSSSRALRSIMRIVTKRNILIVSLVVAVVVALGALTLSLVKPKEAPVPIVAIPEKVTPVSQHTIIGKSVEGRAIDAYTYGNGGTHLLFVGGIHGGYEWNSALLAYELIDYLKENPDAVFKNLTVAVIPSLNPDGMYRIVGKEGYFTAREIPAADVPDGTGRFNAHDVDLNRNFDCKWKPKSTWKSKIVSAGTKAFSEPETAALRDFVSVYTPLSVIFWHSKAGAVYASECEHGILSQTLNITNLYAKASGYGAIKSFTQYEISGDADGWLASINIPAISVELKTHETVEWDRNLAGIKALLEYYSQK